MTNTRAVQVPVEHYASDYDNAGRWSSYWLQIDSMRRLGSGNPMLEVGIGHGLVAHYLRQVCQEDITTVDIDPELAPDVTADICDLPFDDNSFGVVAACEVLEHIPFEDVPVALSEMRRVARKAVVSIPHVSRSVGGSVGLNSRSINVRVELPSVRRRTQPIFEDQHYWELGLKDFDRQRLIEAMETADWDVVDDFRNPGNAWHRFFILT